MRSRAAVWCCVLVSLKNSSALSLHLQILKASMSGVPVSEHSKYSFTTGSGNHHSCIPYVPVSSFCSTFYYMSLPHSYVARRIEINLCFCCIEDLILHHRYVFYIFIFPPLSLPPLSSVYTGPYDVFVLSVVDRAGRLMGYCLSSMSATRPLP